MPKKTFKRKARRRTRKGKKRSRSNRHTGRLLIYNMPKWPLPPTLYTSFYSAIEGTIPSGANATNRYVMQINSLVLPYNTSVGNALPNPLVYTTATLMPQGVSNICNTTGSSGYGFYDFYKVIHVDVIWKMKPQTPGDNMNICMCPFAESFQPASHQASLADPGSYDMDVGCNFPNKLFKRRFSMAKLFGLTSQQYNGDVSGQFSSSFSGDPTQFMNLQFSYQTCDNQTLGTTCGYLIEVIFYCKLWFPIGKLLATN